ncbi:hypothetical protein BRAS3843_530027 [Bradyrhizobium sp. STM 3843]|nr:hypothetical protein BRAS3843_530027 [Bradyrhizobium sp. STM 3843]
MMRDVPTSSLSRMIIHSAGTIGRGGSSGISRTNVPLSHRTMKRLTPSELLSLLHKDQLRLGKLSVARGDLTRAVGGARTLERIESELKVRSVATLGLRQRARSRLMPAQRVEAFRLPLVGAGALFDRGVDLCLNACDRRFAGACLSG